MTIKKDFVTLWDDGVTKFNAVAIPKDSQYKYIEGCPCITVGFTFEDAVFKGFDYFTFFGIDYIDLLKEMEKMLKSLGGHIRLYDMGADTDGYIDISSSRGHLTVIGQLGATFSDFSLKFRFNADQTLLSLLIACIKV